MAAIKGIPHGVSHFNELIDQNFYYMDKTMYLPSLEENAKYLLMTRPHRFGKSLLVSMIHTYYRIIMS